MNQMNIIPLWRLKYPIKKDDKGFNKVSVKTYGVTPDKNLAYKLRSNIEKDYAGGHIGSDIVKYKVDVSHMVTWLFDDL